MTAYGYARVSRTDQNLDLQLDALKLAGVQPENVITDKMSGAKERPAFETLRSKLVSGDSLYAWKMDRLGRSSLAVATFMDECRTKGVRVVITTLGIDTGTPMGRMVHGIMAQIAEFEREQIIERTQAGLDAAKRRGKQLGRKPVLSRAQGRAALAMVAAGQSYSEIGEIMGVAKSVVWNAANLAKSAAGPTS